MSIRSFAKSLVRRTPILRTVVLEWGWGIRVPIAVVVTNYLFQFVLRQNAGMRYPVHFTSRVVHPGGLRFAGRPTSQLTSLAVSGGCYLQAGNGIEIGEGTIWAPNVAIISANHGVDGQSRAWSDDPPVRIGKHCWLGVNAVILPGVVLGDRTVVGAGAVVTRGFPEGHVLLLGVPARAVRRPT